MSASLVQEEKGGKENIYRDLILFMGFTFWQKGIWGFN